MSRYFFAYASQPDNIGRVLREVSDRLTNLGHESTVWPDLAVAGSIIDHVILEEIDAADIVIADLTQLNFNVVFEAGYAIGRGKLLLPTMTESGGSESKALSLIGIFDNIGQLRYTHAADLVQQINSASSNRPLPVGEVSFDRLQPVYLVEPEQKSDAVISVKSKLKKARAIFRVHDPREVNRLSASDVIANVDASAAVVTFLLSSDGDAARSANIKAAFTAGYAYARGIETVLLCERGTSVPMDVKDVVRLYRTPEEASGHIQNLIPFIMEELMRNDGHEETIGDGLLRKIDLGGIAAENEMSDLGSYFLRTSEFLNVCAGNMRLVTGRKGTGKTAIFTQVRNKVRNNGDNVVVDLKPDGYQLLRFKSFIAEKVSTEVAENFTVVFWEYVLLLEVAYKLLEKDRKAHRSGGSRLYEPYLRLADAYGGQAGIGELDFSSRMISLVDGIADRATEFGIEGSGSSISEARVEQIVYSHDIPNLRDAISEYLAFKDDVWVLFDNIDKGWPTAGVTDSDIMILRSLIESLRRIERSFARKRIRFTSVIFIRNDVYENLIIGTSDRGKETRVNLDWTDRSILKEMLRLRLVRNLDDQDVDIDSIWNRICVSHVRSSPSLDFLLDRSLMRPRSFLSLIRHCQDHARNVGNDRIELPDLKAGISNFSSEVASDIGLEILDIFPEGQDVLYEFIGSDSWLEQTEAESRIRRAGCPQANIPTLLTLLMWFGFLGVVTTEASGGDLQEIYIFDVHYDIKKLRFYLRLGGDEPTTMCINPAFRSYLDIVEPELQ